MQLLADLQDRLRNALVGLVDQPEPYVAMLKPTQDAKHGDYQANCAMSLQKVLGKPPREVAQLLIGRLNLGEMLEPPEIAGPGFINLKLRTAWLAQRLQALAKDGRLGVAPVSKPRTYLIDYSSPNVAKPLHVGHLRSTIIGEALTRLLRFVGHKVITDNHLGDWGTQFGILIHGYKHYRDDAALKKDPVQEMLRIYKLVRDLMKEDEDAEGTTLNPVTIACRNETAKLHAGDRENLAIWQMLMPWCLETLQVIYRRLGVHFDHTLGESFYNPYLAEVVASLQAKGIACESQGAIVIPPEVEEEPPALVQKSDKAYTYMTTDLATIQYRVNTWQAESLLYVVDFRQALHFKQLFSAARKWGYSNLELQHISFGSVLGEDGKPMQTRTGDLIGLQVLLDEGVERAGKKYHENRAERLARNEEVPELSAEEQAQLFESIGIGAIKYADLCQNRTSNYVFDFNKMLAMEGNTATYLQYGYVRNRGIFRKGNEEVQRFRTNPPVPTLAQPEERSLAMQIVRFGEALHAASTEYKPNVLTGYLFDLAKSYSVFLQKCNVLKAESPELRESRLLLCDLTGRVIAQGLELLGIATPEKM